MDQRRSFIICRYDSQKMEFNDTSTYIASHDSFLNIIAIRVTNGMSCPKTWTRNVIAWDSITTPRTITRLWFNFIIYLLERWRAITSTNVPPSITIMTFPERFHYLISILTKIISRLSKCKNFLLKYLFIFWIFKDNQFQLNLNT